MTASPNRCYSEYCKDTEEEGHHATPEKRSGGFMYSWKKMEAAAQDGAG